MAVISPTQKQRDRYLGILNTQIANIDQDISNLEEEIRDAESAVFQKTTKKSSIFSALCRELNNYSSEFQLGWPDFSSFALEDDDLSKGSEIRRVIYEEAVIKKVFYDEKTRLHNHHQKILSELEKRNPSKFRRSERRLIPKQIDEQISEIERIKATEYPRASQVSKIQRLLVELDSLKLKRDKQNVVSLEKKILQLRASRLKIDEKRSGQAFELACTEFVTAEREKRKQAAQKLEREAIVEERQRKAEAKLRKRRKELEILGELNRIARLKTQMRKSEKFLATNSEATAVKDLLAKQRAVENLERQNSRAEEACIRKIKQVRLSDRRFHVPVNLDETVLIRELKKRDWPLIPTLDNLVARLKEKSDDLAAAREEEKVASKFLAKFEKAREDIEAYSSASQLAAPKPGKDKKLPPRIPVENWEDAEELAVRYIKWLGFTDARRTKAGSDEGKDVESLKCVAQVKDMGTGATRPMLQQLFGVAAAEKKTPIFFSRGYAKTALEWGERHGIALFKFDLRGTVTPMSGAARKLTSS